MRSRPSGLDRALAWTCALSPAVVLLLVVWATAVTPGYSSVADTLSQLAVAGTPHPMIVTAALLVAVVMCGAFGWALVRRVHDRRRARWIGGLLAITALGVVVSAFVRDDPNIRHGPWTVSGAVHGSAVTIAFVAFVAALFLFECAVLTEPGAAWLAALSRRIFAAALVIGVVFELQVVQVVEGALQRAFLVLFVGWMETVVFGYLLRSPGRSSAPATR